MSDCEDSFEEKLRKFRLNKEVRVGGGGLEKLGFVLVREGWPVYRGEQSILKSLLFI